MRHRFPIQDIEPHYQSLNCPCNPTLFEGDGEDLCFHRAFDRREIIIAIEIFLGIRCEDCGNCIDGKGKRVSALPPYDETTQEG